MHVDDAILRYLGDREITDQSALLALLRAEGFELTLSTLSRRMKRLNIRKERGTYRQALAPRPSSLPVSMRKVQPCLLIVKTRVGSAQALAVALDAAELPSLAGSVAGYDTIFVAPTDPSRLDALEEEVRRCLENGF
jgi:transcriptional regulator of arginine metabolism